MKIKDLKEFIKDLPDDMPVQLLDLTMYDSDLSNYSIKKSDISVQEYIAAHDGQTDGKMLVISFTNKK